MLILSIFTCAIILLCLTLIVLDILSSPKSKDSKPSVLVDAFTRSPLACANPQSFPEPIKPSKAIPFQEWAFGKEGYNEPNLWKAWNLLHGATYPLYPNSIAQSDLDMMQRLYDQAMKKSDKSGVTMSLESPKDSAKVAAVVGAAQKNTLQTKEKVHMKKNEPVLPEMKKVADGIKKSMPSNAASKEPAKMKRAPKIGIKSKKMKGK